MQELNNEISHILLSGIQKTEEMNEYKLYYLNEEAFNELWDIREKKVQELLQAGETEKNAYKNALPLNIINPEKKGVVLTNISEHKAYSLVKDQEKVKKYVIKTFAVWANKQRKMGLKAAKKIFTSEVEIKKFMDKIENKIETTKEEIEYYLNNKDYEIIFTNYKVLPPLKRWVKYVTIVTDENKRLRIRLRKKVINVIYTVEKHIEKRHFPTFVEKELAQADKVLFDEVFIKRKNNANN